MADPETTLTAMGPAEEAWWTPAQLSVVLNEAPSVTRSTLQRLIARGEVRYRAEGSAYQRYPVRQALRDFLRAHADFEYHPAGLAEALPDLGLSARQVHDLLTDLVLSDEIDGWFSACVETP